MNRLIAVIAAVALAPAALAQENPQGAPPAGEAQPTAPSQPEVTPPAPAQPGADTSALQGKVAANEATLAEVKGAVDALKKLKLSGYIQPRFEWQESPANYFNNDPATAPTNQNFFVRRARLKVVYDGDLAAYTVQLDMAARGTLLKEGYVTLKLPKSFAVDAGLQLFPFGYEVGVRSSADLDLLERSFVSNYYLAGEYDLGVALRGKYGPLNFKVGVFNGNGVNAWSFASASAGLDNDQLKDVIGRVGFDLGMVTGGVSGWYGKTIDYASANDMKHDRERLGADLQVFLDLLPIGGTALKGEYIWGRTGIGTANNGAGVALDKTGRGYYAILTQNVGRWNQLAVRWESFTPNNTADTSGATNTTVKTTNRISGAFHTFLGSNYKLSIAYFHPMNGTKGAAAPSDPKGDEYIAQMQAKF
jgi:hypothetical protein